MPSLPSLGTDVAPTDDATAQLLLKRKLAMADALKQQEMPQGQMVAGHYVAPSWTQYLGNLANKWVGGEQEREAIKGYQDYQKTQNQKLGALLDDLSKGKAVTEQGTYDIQVPNGKQAGPTDNLGGMQPYESGMKNISVPMTTTTGYKPYSQQEFMSKVGQVMPELMPKFLETEFARYSKDRTPIKGAPGEVFFDPITHEKMFSVPNKPEKPQAPVVRNMRIGMNDVTQQWNPEKNSWEEIGRGPAFKPEAPDLSVQDLSPAALDMAAETYRTTGVLPATGFGKQGQQLKRAIMNRAGEMNVSAGVSPQDASAAALQGKGDVAAYNQLQKQSTMVKSFEKTARSNGDLALQLSEKADRTGSPIINRWLQAGQKSIAGNPDVSAFNAANETFVNEYAKIMSGSMGNTPVSDSARAHAHEMLSTVQTKEQYRSVMNVLRKEMDNRLHGIDSQLEESRKRLHKGGTSSNKVINFEDL